MARSATILGLAKLQKKLDRLPDVAKTQIKAAMAAEADSVVAMMKSLVAVDSGALRDSIGWTWGKAPKGASVVAAVKSTLGGDLTITIYAGSREAYYARWVEYGVRPKSLEDGPSTTREQGQPFFFVSWRASRKGARRAIRKAVRTSAQQVAKGG